jgi:hypothetical protein
VEKPEDVKRERELLEVSKLTDELQELVEIKKCLAELVRLTRVQTFPNIKACLENSLGSPPKRLAYDLTDGEHSQTEIARAVGVTQPAVSYWWNEWKKLGLTDKSDRYPGRQERCFDLRDFDIPVPSPNDLRGSD